MIESVVFDLGGVMVDWNPRYVFRKLFDDPQEMEWFLANVCSDAWNAQQDAGRPFAEGVKILQPQFPKYKKHIAEYAERWEEMLGDAIHGTVEIFRRLKTRKTPIYALSNWSHETFPIACERFPFLNEFDDRIISGEVKMIKPDPEIFHLMFERFNLTPETTVYIDDSKANIKTAQDLGLKAIHFQSPAQLEQSLKRYELLD